MSRARDIADFNASLFADDEISGDKVSGGTISNLSSTGIDDNASSNALTINSSGNTTFSGNTIHSSAYGYASLKVANALENFDNDMINTTGTTDPYFVFTGDTTNISSSGNHDILLGIKGIYFIHGYFTMYGNSTTYGGENHFRVDLRGNGSTSESTDVIVRGNSFIPASVDNDTTFNQCSLSIVKLFNAGDKMNLHINTEFNDNAELNAQSYLNICLIRQIA